MLHIVSCFKVHSSLMIRSLDVVCHNSDVVLVYREPGRGAAHVGVKKGMGEVNIIR